MNEVAVAPEASVEEPKRRRRWPWIVLGTMTVLGLGAFFLGPIAISAYARSTMTEMATEQGFDLELGRCAFGWTTGLRLEGVRATERVERGIKIDVASVDVVPRWGGLIRGRMSLDEIAVDRPILVIDPSRAAPWPGMDEKSRAVRAARKVEPTGDDPLAMLKRVDARLTVTGAVVRILPAEGRAGLALEECSVVGAFDGATGHATSRIAGRFVTGERRDPLELTLDLTLPPDGSAPTGEGTFQVGGLDLAVLAPLVRSTPRVESGVLSASGRLQTVSQPGANAAIDVQADAQIADLRVREGERVFDASDVRFRFEGAIESIQRLRIARGSVQGLPLAFEADGVFMLRDSRPSFEGTVLTRGKLGDLAAFLPPELALAGALEGSIQVKDDAGTMVVTGGADLADFAVDRAQQAWLRDAKARAEVDLRVALTGDSPSVTGTVDLRGTGVQSKVTITESSLGAQTAKARIETSGSVDAVRQLAPLIDSIESVKPLTGSFKGTWDVDVVARAVHARGGADLSDLRYVWDGRTIVEQSARLDADVRVWPSGEKFGASGTVTVRGSAATMQAKLTSDALPAIAIDGNVTSDPARMLQQVGFELPAGFRVGGKVETKYVGQVNPDAKSKWLTGRFSVRGATLARPGVAIDDVLVEGDFSDELVRFARLDARINGGRVSARANLRLDQPGRPFDVSFDAKGVQISQALAALIRYAVPIYGLPDGIDGEVGGDIDATLSLRGPLPQSFAGLAHLEGRGRARVAKGYVTGSPLVQKIMMATKGRNRYAFDTVTTSFRIREGSVFHDSFNVKDRELAWGFRGKTGFDQAIDYSVNPGPLVERLYERKERKGKMRIGDRLLKHVMTNVAKFPISVGGSLQSPTLVLSELPVLGGLGKGGDLGEAIGGALEGLFGKKKKKKN